jgi:hypothetical protein
MPVWSIGLILGVSLLAAGGVFVLEKLVPASRRESHNDIVGFVYAVVGAQLGGLVQDQQPTAPAAVARYEQAIDAAAALDDARRERIEQSSDGIPPLPWESLVLGGMVTLGFTYFFGAKSNLAHPIVMFSLT